MTAIIIPTGFAFNGLIQTFTFKSQGSRKAKTILKNFKGVFALPEIKAYNQTVIIKAMNNNFKGPSKQKNGIGQRAQKQTQPLWRLAL